LGRYGIEGKVYVSKKGEKTSMWKFDGKNMTLTSPKLKTLGGKTHTFKAFDQITIRMSIDTTTLYEPRIVLECVEPLLDESGKGALVRLDRKVSLSKR